MGHFAGRRNPRLAARATAGVISAPRGPPCVTRGVIAVGGRASARNAGLIRRDRGVNSPRSV